VFTRTRTYRRREELGAKKIGNDVTKITNQMMSFENIGAVRPAPETLTPGCHNAAFHTGGTHALRSVPLRRTRSQVLLGWLA